MHALRAGLSRRRIDNKKNKEKWGRQTSGDLSPILSLEDSNGASPAKAPLSWEQFSLKTDVQLLLSDENVRNHFDENNASPTEDLSVFDPRAQKQGDKSPLIHSTVWESTAEYEENIPPGNNFSISKVKKIPKWKQAIPRANESEQPLLVESSTTNSSRDVHVDPLTPKNVIGWNSIQTEGTTDYSSRQSFGIPLSRHHTHTDHDDPTKSTLWKQENHSTQGQYQEDSVRQKPKQVTTFDPFADIDDFGLESHEDIHQPRHDFSTARENFRSLRAETTEIDQIQKSRIKEEEFHQARAFQQFDRITHVTPTENVGSTAKLNDSFSQNQEYNSVTDVDQNSSGEYLEEMYHSRENEFQDAHEAEACIESYVSQTFESEDEIILRGHQNYRNNTETSLDHLESFVNEEVLAEDGSSDFEDASADMDSDIYSVRKMEHIRSIYTSKYLNALSNSPEDEEQVIDQVDSTSMNSDSVEHDGSKLGLKFVALFSEFSGTLRQRTEQERAISILYARDISNVEKVDGSSEHNKDRRNMLFEISGEKGKYPQFFLQKGQNITVYLGGFEWLQYMNDIGSLNDETIFGVTQADETMADASNSNIRAPKDHTSVDRNLPFSKRATAFDDYKIEQFRDDGSPHQLAENFERLSYENEATNYLDFPTTPNPRYSSESASLIDIESTDARDTLDSKNFTDMHGNTAVSNEPQEDAISCEAASVENSEYGGPKTLNVFTDAGHDSEDTHINGADTFIEKSAPRLEQNENGFFTDELHVEQSEDQSNVGSGSISSSNSGKSLRAVLESRGALLDTDSEVDSVPFTSPTSPVTSARDSKTSQPDNPIMEDKYAANLDSSSYEIENGESTNIPFDGEYEINACRESPKIEKDDVQTREQMEKQARRRARWKRRIIAEHLGKHSADVCRTSSSVTEDPIGSSQNEIVMINTFMMVLGSDFHGPLSPNELEGLYDRAQKAGLTREFTDRMLSAQPSPTASDSTSYDDRGFTRKTPNPQTKMDCLVQTFWAESSNIVGGDMVENIQAAVSADADESQRDLKRTGSTESKSRWPSVNMIESIKASFSGDSNEKGWRSVDMIGSIKASLSGEGNEKGWRSVDMIGSIKASLSGEGNEKGWGSSDVIQNIKAAFSTDSDSKVEDTYTKKEIECSEEGLQSYGNTENKNVPVELENGSLYEC